VVRFIGAQLCGEVQHIHLLVKDTGVENVKSELGVKVLHREFEQFGGAYALREPSEPYAADLDSESDALRLKNTIAWNETPKLRRHKVFRSGDTNREIVDYMDPTHKFQPAAESLRSPRQR
jgi:hypothetical protein